MHNVVNEQFPRGPLTRLLVPARSLRILPLVMWVSCMTGLTTLAFAEASAKPGAVSDVEDVDHSGIIASWDLQTLARGEKLYHTLCLPCHGTPQQQGSLPVSRAFWKEPFKNGNDPFSIYKTIGNGLGQMPAWPWLSGELRYDVIDYI